MGVWKVGCNIKIRPESKAALEEFAKREMRTLGKNARIYWEKWRAQEDDLRTFLAEFVSILPQAKSPTQIEALINRDL
jgi:hypothetical protein